MNSSVIIRLVILGILWLALVVALITRVQQFTLYNAFVIVVSAIIIFVPVYKKYADHEGDRK